MEEKNKSEFNASGVKKPYAKPELLRVGLRPEEAVLGACKNGPTTGGGAGGQCTPGSCLTVGS